MRPTKHTFRNYMNFRMEQVARTARDAADKVYRRECGLDIQHVRILRIVSEMPGQSVNRVVRESNLDRTLVSRIVTKLVKLKLLERTISPHDARQFLLGTTTYGEETVRKANVLGDALNRDLLNVLDQDEQDTLETCLERLSKWRPRE